MVRACIALGSNLGDRESLLDRAVELLAEIDGVRVVAVSSRHCTRPVGGPAGQGDYLNAAAVVETDLEPGQLLAAMQQIESDLGRSDADRRVHHGPRTIDLDLLLYEDLRLQSDELELPHPRMHERAFVLVPLAEIAPKARHPVLELTVEEMLALVKARQGAGDE